MLVSRKLAEDITAYIEPEGLFWVITDNKNSVNQDEKILKRLKEEVRQRSERVRLELVEIHLTSSCNLKCKYCYVPPDRKKQNRYLTIEEVDKIISKIFNYSYENKTLLPRVIFHGGEPLLAFNTIKKIVEKYYGKIKFSIQTNATLLEDSVIDFLERFNVSVGISVDAEQNSRGINKDEIFDRIKKFKNIKNIGVVSTITNLNVKNLPYFIEELYNFGIPSIVLNPVSPENKDAVKLVPDRKELIENYKLCIDKVISLNSKGKHKIIIDNVEGFILPLISNYSPIYCRNTPCGAGRLNLVVAPDGSVYPCSGFVGFEEFKCGNIFESDFKKLLFSNPAISLRERNVNKIENCKFCAYKNICGANCPIPLYFLYKDINLPSFYCSFYQEIIDFILFCIYKDNKNIEMLISDSYLSIYKNSKIIYEQK